MFCREKRRHVDTTFSSSEGPSRPDGQPASQTNKATSSHRIPRNNTFLLADRLVVPGSNSSSQNLRVHSLHAFLFLEIHPQHIALQNFLFLRFSKKLARGSCLFDCDVAAHGVFFSTSNMQRIACVKFVFVMPMRLLHCNKTLKWVDSVTAMVLDRPRPCLSLMGHLIGATVTTPPHQICQILRDKTLNSAAMANILGLTKHQLCNNQSRCLHNLHDTKGMVGPPFLRRAPVCHFLLFVQISESGVAGDSCPLVYDLRARLQANPAPFRYTTGAVRTPLQAVAAPFLPVKICGFPSKTLQLSAASRRLKCCDLQKQEEICKKNEIGCGLVLQVPSLQAPPPDITQGGVVAELLLWKVSRILAAGFEWLGALVEFPGRTSWGFKSTAFKQGRFEASKTVSTETWVLKHYLLVLGKSHRTVFCYTESVFSDWGCLRGQASLRGESSSTKLLTFTKTLAGNQSPMHTHTSVMGFVCSSLLLGPAYLPQHTVVMATAHPTSWKDVHWGRTRNADAALWNADDRNSAKLNGPWATEMQTGSVFPTTLVVKWRAPISSILAEISSIF